MIALVESNSWFVLEIEALGRIALNSDAFTRGLFDAGITKFIDGDKPIVYGTLGQDTIFASARLTTAPYLEPFASNGAVVVGADGVDEIFGTQSDDFLLGGEGNDTVLGDFFENLAELALAPGGNDTLTGGPGNDFLDGSKGDDVAVFSDRFENYTYLISGEEGGEGGEGGEGEEGGEGGEGGNEIFGKTITFIHNKGTQTDGTDTLKDIEFAQFSDRTVSIASLTNPDGTVETDEIFNLDFTDEVLTITDF